MLKRERTVKGLNLDQVAHALGIWPRSRTSAQREVCLEAFDAAHGRRAPQSWRGVSSRSRT